MNGTMYDSALPIPPEYVAPPETPAPQSPVVTDGAASAGNGSPYQGFFDAYERMQQLRQPAEATNFFGMTPQQSQALDRLGAFGAALAGTRRSDFAGALSEGLQAMRQAGTAQRQEARQNRQIDVEAAYRAAQEARQMAELEFARDPNNPLNLLRVTQARTEEARINLLRRQAANVGADSGTARRGTPQVLIQDGQVVYFYPATGETVRAPQGALPPGVLGREEAAIQRDITTFGQLNRTSPRYMNDPAALTADAEAYAARQAAARAQRRTGESASGAPTEPAMAPIRIQPNQQPVR